MSMNRRGPDYAIAEFFSLAGMLGAIIFWFLVLFIGISMFVGTFRCTKTGCVSDRPHIEVTWSRE